MTNDDGKTSSERLRALYRQFCEDQDLHWSRYFERSRAETKHLTKIRRAAVVASTTTEDA